MASLSSLPPSKLTHNYGPFSATTRYIALPFERPRIDNNVAHDSRVKRESVGIFCGSPIFTLDKNGMDADVLALVGVYVDLGKKQRAEGLDSVPAEVLPGEEICSDNIIRRSTTAEAIGYDKFYTQEDIVTDGWKEVGIETARLVSMAGKVVHWIGNDKALVEEEA